jgi:hypothetical protein
MLTPSLRKRKNFPFNSIDISRDEYEGKAAGANSGQNKRNILRITNFISENNYIK